MSASFLMAHLKQIPGSMAHFQQYIFPTFLFLVEKHKQQRAVLAHFRYNQIFLFLLDSKVLLCSKWLVADSRR